LQSKAQKVTGYLAEQPAEHQAILKKLRAVIRKTVPRVKESMLYGMPTYRIGEEAFCGFALQKGYLAFYMCNPALVARFRSELGTKDCGKGCIRYRKPEEIRLPVIERLLEAAYADQAAAKAKTG
jgi:uncharacterized protein YdhG (YjbR/CyaY superfamily)